MDRAGWAGRRPVLWGVAVLTSAVVAWLLSLRTAVDVDLWLHLRIGEYLREGGRFTTGPDPFVVLADRTYVPTQWLGEVVLSWVHDAGGLTAVHALRAVGLVLLGLAVLATARATCGPVVAGVITLFALFGTSAAWGERPQLAGMVLFATSVLLWTRAWRRGGVPWLVVPLTWVWAMLHGSWVLGLAVGAVFVLAMALEPAPRPARSWLRLGVVVAGSTTAAALTPLGPQLLLQPFVVTDVARSTVNEWQRPALGNPLMLLVVVMALVVLARLGRTWRTHLPELVVALSAVALAVWSVRTIAFGSLLMVPALAGAFADPAREPVTRREVWPWLLAAVLVVVLPGSVVGAPTEEPLRGPVSSALDALPAGDRVVAEPELTGWVLWAHPELDLMRDLRVEAYSPEVATAYERFLRAEPGWQEYSARHGVDDALLAADSALSRAMEGDPAWRATAAGDGVVLWQRDR